MEKVRAAVVIPSWNSARDLPKLLKSLRDQRLKTAELTVILSDNNSDDDSVAVARKCLPSVIIVRNIENLGLAGGNNEGMKRAIEMGEELVVGMNADTVADRDLIESLVEGYRRHPLAILSPKIYFAPGREFHHDWYKRSERGKVIWYAGGCMDWQNVFGSNRGVDEVDRGQYDVEVETDFATGCCFLIPAELIRKTRGFDERLFLYYEDTDLSMRVKSAGGEIWYIPSGKLWHVNAGSSGVGSGLQDYFTTRNRLLFGMRWAPLRARLALLRDGLRLAFRGRQWQRRGARDFFLGRFAKGSYPI